MYLSQKRDFTNIFHRLPRCVHMCTDISKFNEYNFSRIESNPQKMRFFFGENYANVMLLTCASDSIALCVIL